MNPEASLAKLANNLNRKRIEFYEIIGIPKVGELVSRLNETQIFDEDIDYNVALNNFNASSFFPNIKKDINDMFYYKTKHQLNLMRGLMKLKTYPKLFNCIYQQIVLKFLLMEVQESL